MDPRLIVALDYPEAAPALDLADRLEDVCCWFKVGLELYLAEGNALVHELRNRGYEVRSYERNQIDVCDPSKVEEALATRWDVGAVLDVFR